MKQPNIIMNGITLDPKHIEVLRVAINNFYAAVTEPGSLGSDTLGEEIRDRYVKDAASIIKFMQWPVPPDAPPHPFVAEEFERILLLAIRPFRGERVTPDLCRRMAVAICAAYHPALAGASYPARARHELPYLARTVEPNGTDHFLIGGNAKATLRSEVVDRRDERTGDVVPMLAIHIPVSKFERIAWSILEDIAKAENGEAVLDPVHQTDETILGAADRSALVAAVAKNFPSFGGGRTGNSIVAVATADREPMFAAGVDIAEVVDFVLKHFAADPSPQTGDEEATAEIKPIPIAAAKRLAKDYGYDQVLIYARRCHDTPEPHGEHMTTYGRNREHCDVAARIGDTLKKFMGWEV